MKKSIMRIVTLVSILSGLFCMPRPSMAEEVYVIRGFTNVFSYGMDEIVKKLQHMGINASIHSNGEWTKLTQNIIDRAKHNRVSYPIIIMGHSLGGVEAPKFANELAQHGIPVALVVGLDPGFPPVNSFGPGVRNVLNIKLPSGRDYIGGNGFQGKVLTIDARKYNVSHTSIDDSEEVQSLIIDAVKKAL